MDSNKSERRSAERRKRRLRRLLLRIAVIAGGVALVVGIIAIINLAVGSGGFGTGGKTSGDQAGDIAEGAGEESELIQSMKYLWYYDEDRAERYDSFSLARPGLAYDEVCWMVNCDLDRNPYESTTEVSNPNSILVLVNKHFSLPEGYVPDDLTDLGEIKIRKEAGDALLEMFGDAWVEGHTLWTTNGYRTEDLQRQLYNRYLEKDGQAAADTYSARPGHSEHQTGLAVDLNNLEDDFGDTPEGGWAIENCWKYGYILRYTSKNTAITGFKSEPWHIRYVGKDVAKTIHDEGIVSFEEYWVKNVRYSVN